MEWSNSETLEQKKNSYSLPSFSSAIVLILT